MNPVVLLVGRLPHVTGAAARELEHLPVDWLGAHDEAEVVRQLEAEPRTFTTGMSNTLMITTFLISTSGLAQKKNHSAKN